MKALRVSRWFAMGHSHASKKLPKAALEKMSVENQYQRDELLAGFEEGTKAVSHIQFWLVEGEFTHDEMKKLIDGKTKK